MPVVDPYAPPTAEVGSNESSTCQPHYLALKGRIGRMRYLAYSFGSNVLVGVMVMIAASFTGVSVDVESGHLPGGLGGLMIGLIYVGLAVFLIAFGVRRLNDANRTGWWMLTMFVPVINLILLLYLMLASGTQGNNDYGPMPTANGMGVILLGSLLPVLALLGIVSAVLIPTFLAASAT